MKHLKTYEGLFDFLKKKPKEVKREFVISDDMFDIISDIIQDVDMMGLGVHIVMTEGKRKVYSTINRAFSNGGFLKDYDLNELCHILTRLVDYVRSESENQINVHIDFIENDSKGGYRITNPTEAKIYNQLSTFHGNLVHDWRSLKISIVPDK